MDPDYSVIRCLFETPFERRKAMFRTKNTVLPRTVRPHRQLACQREENGHKALAAAMHFEVTHKR